jgi:hypothetical protein
MVLAPAIQYWDGDKASDTTKEKKTYVEPSEDGGNTLHPTEKESRFKGITPYSIGAV